MNFRSLPRPPPAEITNEAPVGMKAGLRASYSWVSQDMLDQVNRPEWRQLLFIMCYMHSIVQVGDGI